MSDSAQSQFEALFRAQYARVLAYALRRTRDRPLAEEITAEVFLTAWRRLDSIPPDGQLPWLLATARKTLANHWRAAAIRPPSALSGERVAEAGGPDLGDQLAQRDLVARAFAALGDGDREVLALVAWEGLEPSEAAAVLGIAAPVFSVRLHRARSRLKKQLEKLEAG